MTEEGSPVAVKCQIEVPAVIRLHFDHYMHLLDLYETRQTSAFNFAILVYTAAGAAAGFFAKSDVVHCVVTGAAEPASVLIKGAVILIYSVGVPLILLPLFYLYIDVSIFCAALNAGSFTFLGTHKEEDWKSEDPGVHAFMWLNKIGEDISPHFKMRAALFAWAPLFGLFLAGIELSLIYNQHSVGLDCITILGLLISGTCLGITAREIMRNNRVRDKSLELKRTYLEELKKKSPEET